jgi:hypothetical protein
VTAPRFDELLGDDVPAGELARLRRVHDALVASGPPPELSPPLREPPGRPHAEVVPILPRGYPRRRGAAAAVLAAALAIAAFGGGYLAASDEFEATRIVKMRGTDAAPNARASIQLGKPDDGGNWPMVLTIQGLQPLPGRGYYELYLTRDGEPLAQCGTFDVEGDGQTKVQLSAAYDLERFDGWVVLKHVPPAPPSDEILLTT